jgi:hypothetical protein
VLIRRGGLTIAGLTVCLLAGTGCSDKGYSKYVPAEDDARLALEKALDAWCNGLSPRQIEATAPAVQMVDSRWQAGHQLSAYEILQEEPGEGPRVFSVRLTMRKPAGQLTVRYFIVGRDPLWVYREDDYKAPAGM